MVTSDDLMLFGQANVQQTQILKGILDRFCKFSGHRINSQKTNIFFSKEVDENLTWRISNFLGFHRVNNLGSYLGMPLFHERVTNSTLWFVVDKIQSKLNSWDARKFSLVGRVTLAQLVLLTILSFFLCSL